MNLILGAGSVGTVLAAYLVQSGHPVQIQVRANKLEKYRDLKRLQVINADDQMLVDVPAPEIVGEDAAATATHIFLCVKRGALDDVLKSLKPKLPKTTVILPCINGVGLDKAVKAVLPDNPVAPTTIMFNARVEAPLLARLTTHAEVLVGGDRPDLHSLFSADGISSAESDKATEWGKLLINLNNAICALTHRTFSDLFGGETTLMKCFIAVLDEAVGVLRHANIPYSMPAPVPYPVYRFLLLHGRGLPLWIARRKNGLSDQAHPSMRADLEQGRLTEVDYLNGAVVALAQEHGLSAPVNAKLVKLVHDREAQSNSQAAACDWSPSELLTALEDV